MTSSPLSLEEPFLLTKEGMLKAFEILYLSRLMDEKMEKLAKQNKGGAFHLSTQGHEMIGALAALSLRPGVDWGFPYYRDRAFAIGWGCSLSDLIGALLARAVPHHSGGRMMPDHFSHKSLRLPCQSSVVGSQFLQAVGVAKAIQLAGKDEVVYVSAGDGATSQGDFHEALNFAALHRLPVLFVIQDNEWAISVPSSEQTAGGSIAERAKGFAGLSIHEIDGCHYPQAASVLSEASLRARRGEGPSLIIAKVPRIGPHSSSDDPAKYKTEEMIAKEKGRDPLPRIEAFVIEEGVVVQEEMEALKRTLCERIEEAARLADALPFPDPSTAAARLFCQSEEVVESPEEERLSFSSEGIVMVDALNRALHEEMALDERVVVFGQDVARRKGGVFRVTHELTERYGTERCFNTPLAESTIVGLALGMSLAHGFKPVAEIQFADYMWTGINQIVNELSSIHYRSNGEWNCPLVIRMPCGGYIQGGPYHSQSVESFLAHCPGLKIVFPSHAADAKRLLKAAIRDPNPVIFLEHKALYRQRFFCAREEPPSHALLPLGKAQVVLPGSDVTLIGWGMTVVMGYEVAQRLAKEGISVELIDLRTLVPFDKESVLASVRKTGKVLIAHEAPLFGGFGAEVAAQIAEECFSYLDAPIKRVGAKECAVPYSKVLEEAVLPQAQEIEKALRELAQF